MRVTALIPLDGTLMKDSQSESFRKAWRVFPIAERVTMPGRAKSSSSIQTRLIRAKQSTTSGGASESSTLIRNCSPPPPPNSLPGTGHHHFYVERVRHHAAGELWRSGFPTIQTGLQVGFTYQSPLNRHFKKMTGITPGKYLSAITSKTPAAPSF